MAALFFGKIPDQLNELFNFSRRPQNLLPHTFPRHSSTQGQLNQAPSASNPRRIFLLLCVLARVNAHSTAKARKLGSVACCGCQKPLTTADNGKLHTAVVSQTLLYSYILLVYHEEAVSIDPEFYRYRPAVRTHTRTHTHTRCLTGTLKRLGRCCFRMLHSVQQYEEWLNSSHTRCASCVVQLVEV